MTLKNFQKIFKKFSKKFSKNFQKNFHKNFKYKIYPSCVSIHNQNLLYTFTDLLNILYKYNKQYFKNFKLFDKRYYLILKYDF